LLWPKVTGFLILSWKSENWETNFGLQIAEVDGMNSLITYYREMAAVVLPVGL
jgi:hypothetical protein